MKCISSKTISINEQGIRTVDAFILADTTPAILPTTGADIDGLSDKDVFAPFSILYIANSAPHKTFIADESGNFVAQ